MKGGGRLDVEQTKRALIWLIVSVLVGGLVLAGLWTLRRGRQLLPPRTCTLTPWTLGELLLAIVVFVGVPVLTFQLVRVLGFFRWYHGADPDPNNVLDFFRADLWITLLAPLTICAILCLLRLTSNTRPWHVGFARKRGADNTALAYLWWLAAAPATLAVHYLVLHLYQSVFAAEPAPHLLQKLAATDLTPTEWLLLVLKAGVWAPVLEEFLFRGLMLPWAVRTWWGGLACAGAAVVLPLLSPNLRTGPLVFSALLAAPVLLALRRNPAEQAHWANWSVALLFAMLHASVWPTPIPLFVLGLWLGWLQQRTQSLWGPIIVHGLFNGFSTLLLLLGVGAK